MLNKQLVRESLNRAGQRFDTCWKILSDLKNQSVEQGAFLEFQPTLAEALFDLEELHRNIRSEERRLVGRKEMLSEKWFRSRMRTLAHYRDAVTAAMGIGRGIGDAFAWIFYYRHRDYLRKHLEHQALTSLPPGIGGRGELEFLRQIKSVGNSFAIYHGTTTFLRVGDVSLFELDSLHFLGLGELKTDSIGPGEIEITVHVISSEISRVLPPSPPTAESSEERVLPEHIRARLARQLAEMTKALEVRPPHEKRESTSGFHTTELQRLSRALQRQRVAYQRVGDGLLLVGIRERRNRDLGSRLLNNDGYSDGLTDDLNRQVRGIVASDSAENSIVVGGVDLTLLPGATPHFWWDVDQDFLRSIYFRKTVVATVYNPAFLVKKLRNAGLTVERSQSSWELRVSKELNGQSAVLEGFRYFTDLITKHLVREETVVEMLVGTMDRLEAEKSDSNRRVELDVRLHWI